MAALLLAGCAASPAPHPIVAAAAPVPEPPVDSRVEEERATRGHEDSGHAERQRNRAIGWVAVAVGGEATAIAVITSFMMLHDNDVRNTDCPNKVCTQSGIQANTSLHQLEGWNAAAWVVGAIGIGGGAFLLLTNPSDRALHTQVGVTPGGLLLRGAF
jgi:hypothetical protein